MNQPFVPSYHIALRVDKVAGNGFYSHDVGEKSCVIVILNKTNILAVRLTGIYQVLFFGYFPDFAFKHIPQGKQGSRKLLLRHGIENVGLIFRCIFSFLQEIPLLLLIILHSGIMACSDIVISEKERPFQKLAELDVPVAINAWVRRLTFLIRICKSLHYVPLKIQSEIEDIVTKTQTLRHYLRIFHIEDGTAGPGFVIDAQIFIVVELQSDPADIIALFQQQSSCNGTVNSSAHSYQYFFLHIL